MGLSFSHREQQKPYEPAICWAAWKSVMHLIWRYCSIEWSLLAAAAAGGRGTKVISGSILDCEFIEFEFVSEGNRSAIILGYVAVSKTCVMRCSRFTNSTLLTGQHQARETSFRNSI